MLFGMFFIFLHWKLIRLIPETLLYLLHLIKKLSSINSFLLSKQKRQDLVANIYLAKMQ